MRDEESREKLIKLRGTGRTELSAGTAICLDVNQDCVSTLGNLEALMWEFSHAQHNKPHSAHWINVSAFIDWLASQPPRAEFCPLAEEAGE